MVILPESARNVIFVARQTEIVWELVGLVGTRCRRLSVLDMGSQLTQDTGWAQTRGIAASVTPPSKESGVTEAS